MSIRETTGLKDNYVIREVNEMIKLTLIMNC